MNCINCDSAKSLKLLHVVFIFLFSIESTFFRRVYMEQRFRNVAITHTRARARAHTHTHGVPGDVVPSLAVALPCREAGRQKDVKTAAEATLQPSI